MSFIKFWKKEVMLPHPVHQVLNWRFEALAQYKQRCKIFVQGSSSRSLVKLSKLSTYTVNFLRAIVMNPAYVGWLLHFSACVYVTEEWNAVKWTKARVEIHKSQNKRPRGRIPVCYSVLFMFIVCSLLGVNWVVSWVELSKKWARITSILVSGTS